MSYILLVEDNLDNANMIIRLLETDGYTVRHFTMGLPSIAMVRQERPSLILMDFNLPDIDGRTLVLSLKKQLGGDKAPPVIAVTARTGPIEELMAKRYGCSAFVNKPFDPQEFMALIREFAPLEQL
jgi:CheY-like chemotaxis protein